MRLEVVFCLDRDQDLCVRNQRSAASPAFLSVSGILKDFQLSFPKQSSRSVCSPFNSTPHHTHSPHSPFRNLFFLSRPGRPHRPNYGPCGWRPFTSDLRLYFSQSFVRHLCWVTGFLRELEGCRVKFRTLNPNPPITHTHTPARTQTLKLSISNAIFALFQLY